MIFYAITTSFKRLPGNDLSGMLRFLESIPLLAGTAKA
jgi:hypothetical protein